MTKMIKHPVEVPQPDVSNLLTGAKIVLLQRHPFYASLALKMDFQESHKVKTAATDGKAIFYNSNYIQSLDLRQVVGLLAHEVMHVALLHHTRRSNRRPRRWNYACDYAINPILLEAKLKLPDYFLYDETYLGMSAEEIYDLIPEVDESEPEGFGEVLDQPGADSATDLVESVARSMVSQAIVDANFHGGISGTLARVVGEMMRPKIDWREALSRFLTEVSKNDYCMSKPSPRFLYRQIYLPTLESIETGSVILIIDTSGSIKEEMISQFCEEVKCISETFSIPLAVIYVDACVQSIQEFGQGDDIDLKPAGGGGTDFCPGFEYISSEDLSPRAVVYLTDGECSSFPDEPDYGVLWAQFGKRNFHPPFGEVVKVTH